jgi:hypothetical protein
MIPPSLAYQKNKNKNKKQFNKFYNASLKPLWRFE